MGILDLMDRFGVERADALKIDIEGAEERALIPFFERCPPGRLPGHIFMELSSHRWTIDCVDLTKRQGYDELTRTHMNVVLQRRA
jgi:hypothetical protein